MAWLASWVYKALAVWEAVQVELHGQYSIQRLHAVRQYIASTSLFHAAAVLVLTPLPSLCVIVGLDALPLVSPREGASKQTIGFWFRWFIVAWSSVYFTTLIVGQLIPALSMPQRRLWPISLGISTVMMGITWLTILIAGFPVPFAFQVQIVPIVFFVGTAWWFSWKNTLRADPVVKADFIHFLKLCRTFCVMFGLYVAYNVVYNQLRGPSQFLFSFLLPVIKILLEVRASGNVYHFEDSAPTQVVSSVDVFHTLFTSLTMQQTPTSTLTLSLFMTIDGVQGVIAAYEVVVVVVTRPIDLAAAYEVRQVVKRLDALQAQVGCKDQYPVTRTLFSLQGGYLSHVAKILETNEYVRQHPSVAFPRHIRDAQPQENGTTRALRDPTRGSNRTTIWPAQQPLRGPTLQPIELALLASGRSQPMPPSTCASQDTLAKLEYTQKALKLLHMVEFYTLIEYVEVMIAALYAAYLSALSKMPNRVYYPQLAMLSDVQMEAAAAQVARYAVLELVSLVVFFWVLRWQIKGFSPARQLSFALQTHWIEIQAAYMIALVLAVQLSLEHNGTDFTFKFKWLHDAKPGGAQP